MTTGTVAEFSDPRGIGLIVAEGATYAFHCTQIADGTRTVRIGATVDFDIVPGRRGDWEAAHIEKIDASGKWRERGATRAGLSRLAPSGARPARPAGPRGEVA